MGEGVNMEQPTIEVLSTTLNHLGKRRSNFYLSLNQAKSDEDRTQYRSEIERLDAAIAYHERKRREVAGVEEAAT